MICRTYEIHLRQHLPAEIGAELDVRTSIEEPVETVLLTGRIDQAGLYELIGRLRDFGIELLELRRRTVGPAPSKQEPR
jgi:hypothetical protein